MASLLSMGDPSTKFIYLFVRKTSNDSNNKPTTQLQKKKKGTKGQSQYNSHCPLYYLSNLEQKAHMSDFATVLNAQEVAS